MANINTAAFFSEKTIKKPYLFSVELSQPYETLATKKVNFPRFKEYVEGFLLPSEHSDLRGFKLKPYHVKNVSLPDFNFGKDVTKYGPFAKSTANMQFDGFELKIELEEDKEGSIKRFIQYLQARIIHQSGISWPMAFTNLPYIQITVLNEDGLTPQTEYRFKECYLLTVSEVTYSYSESSAISYSLTFNANTYENNI